VARDIDAAGGQALVVPTDVRRLADIQDLVAQTLARFGRIDVLFNNAGFGRLDWLENLDPLADIEALVAVNVLGVVQATRQALPVMIRQRAGLILNIASVAATRALPGAAAYTATKAGVVGWSRVLAEELRPHGVRVGVLVPGAVDTPLWDTIPGGPDRARMLTADTVARAVLLMVTLPAGATMEDIDLMEMHEAFAAQVLSNLQAMESAEFAERELGRTKPVGHPPLESINVMGGSIAIGHPFAATGGRITMTLLNEMRRRNAGLGLITVCAAGGMGFAMVVEAA